MSVPCSCCKTVCKLDHEYAYVWFLLGAHHKSFGYLQRIQPPSCTVGLSVSTDVQSKCFKFLFFQGLLEQCSLTEYSMAWFMQAASNAIGIKISQYHPLSIVDSRNCGSYFTDACLCYTPSLNVTVHLPSCDLIMCQHKPGSINSLTPTELYITDEYHMNHWSLLCQTSPGLALGKFPFEECKTWKVPLPHVQFSSSCSVVEQDQQLCDSFLLVNGFGNQDEPEQQVFIFGCLKKVSEQLMNKSHM